MLIDWIVCLGNLSTFSSSLKLEKSIYLKFAKNKNDIIFAFHRVLLSVSKPRWEAQTLSFLLRG